MAFASSPSDARNMCVSLILLLLLFLFRRCVVEKSESHLLKARKVFFLFCLFLFCFCFLFCFFVFFAGPCADEQETLFGVPVVHVSKHSPHEESVCGGLASICTDETGYITGKWAGGLVVAPVIDTFS
jgi:hypothetical protein